MNELLEMESVEKAFHGVRVLKGVSIRAREGQITGIVGENGAGKSTLMNILGGNLVPDSGEMQFCRRTYAPRSPQDAAKAGIGFIHQELNLFPNLSIAENLFLTSFPLWNGLPFIQRREMEKRTRELLLQVGLDQKPGTMVEKLSAGERQLVEIAKASSLNARLIILDEPTTSLSARETGLLFDLMKRLRAQGMAMIYISHNLGDVLALCDEVIVLRDGEVIRQGECSGFTIETLIADMVGRSVSQLFPQRKGKPGKAVVLEVEGVTQPGVVRDIGFQLHEGEIVGLAGLMGAGRTELARILFGLDPCERGEVRIHGERVEHLEPRCCVHRGMALVTENRRGEGLCLEASIADNIALVSLRQHAGNALGLIDPLSWGKSIETIRKAVRLTGGVRGEQAVQTLSGGNQQKVVLAKWLIHQPSVLILDEPTRGIDVGAKLEIYELILEMADKGMAVLVISSEVEELMGICDRILVMKQGVIRKTFSQDDFDREDILGAAFGDATKA